MKYGLSPAILSTCRQIFEASSVLYRSNTFIVELVDNHGWSYLPIARQYMRGRTRGCFSSFREIPIAKKIKHWKVILSTYRLDWMSLPHKTVLDFLDAICLTPPSSIEILLLPRKRDLSEGDKVLPWSQVTKSDYRLRDILEPFRILRNVESFKVGVVEADGINLIEGPWTWLYHDSLPIVTQSIPPKLWKSLKELVQGDTPVERLRFMNESLLAYAQFFERSETYRREMRMDFGVTKSERLRRENQPNIWDAAKTFNSPFKQYSLHPVEDALELACIASEEEDPQSFKTQRKIVLEYLEPQYRRIITTATILTEFIKAEKTNLGLFDANHHSPNSWEVEQQRFAEAVLLIEDFAKAFNRDMPYETRVNIRIRQREFDLSYEVDSSGRAKLLQQLDRYRNLDMSIFHFCLWI